MNGTSNIESAWIIDSGIPRESRFQETSHPENWIPHLFQIPPFQSPPVPRTHRERHFSGEDLAARDHVRRHQFSSVVVVEQIQFQALNPRFPGNVFWDFQGNWIPLRVAASGSQITWKTTISVWVLFGCGVFRENELGFLEFFGHGKIGGVGKSEGNAGGNL